MATGENAAMASNAGNGARQSTSPYREDDGRRREEARVSTLQSQVDELRQGLRELISRQTRQEELAKIYESGVAQNRLSLEQVRQESQQSAQARALDENRTRQQVADLENRFEDAIRPIRSLQAHVGELLEASRQKVDTTGLFERRFDEIAAAIEHFAAQNDRNAVVNHQLRDALDLLRTEIDQIHRDGLRTEDAIKIVDQDARRRVAEVAETSAVVAARIDDLRADAAHLADILDETRRSLVHIDPTFEELRAVDVVIRDDFTRFQAKTIETHAILRDRADDIQQDSDARFADLRQVIEQRAERLSSRIEALSETHRELEYRIAAFTGELEGLRQVDAGLRRDIWYLHEQRVRFRFEQIQQELDHVTHQRRDAESGAEERGAPKPRGRIAAPVGDMDF